MESLVKHVEKILLLSIAFLGIARTIVFGYYFLIVGFAAKGHTNFSKIVQSSPDLATVFAAEAQQDIHKMNPFAEGVWSLQSALIAAVGVHGMCVNRR